MPRVRGGSLERRLLVPLLVVGGLVGAGLVVATVPSVEPGPTPVEVPAAGPSRSDARPSAPANPPQVGNPGQSAIRPIEVPDPLDRDVLPSQPPVDDPEEWAQLAQRQAAEIAARQQAEAEAFLDSEGATEAERAAVLAALGALADRLATIRIDIQIGAMSPADGREAIREARQAVRSEVEAAIGPERTEALGKRLRYMGGAF